jgi:hypothetical protein
MMCQHGGLGILLCEDDGCDYCFYKSFDSVDTPFIWLEENVLSARQVFKGSTLRRSFKCGGCNHLYKLSPNEIMAGKICDFCNNKKLCENVCTTCREKSMASVNDSLFRWSGDNVLSARYVFKDSDSIYKFNCKKCDHISCFSPRDLENETCDFCDNWRLCEDDKCKICYEKSYASVCDRFPPEGQNCWGKKNDKNPRKVFKNDEDNKYWFKCFECFNEGKMKLFDISGNGVWCCCQKFTPSHMKQELCDNEDCGICYERSFASCARSQFLSDSNGKEARWVDKRDPGNFWFECDKCGRECKLTLKYIVANVDWCAHCKED